MNKIVRILLMFNQKMFRIKPVKNHTIAKYSYQNSSVPPKENALDKLTSIIKPKNLIITHGKTNLPLKQFVRPQNANKDQESKLNNPRLTKPHEKPMLKKSLNSNQHKLKIPIVNQPLSKQKISQHNSIKDTLKKQQISIQKNSENDIVEKNQFEDKNIVKRGLSKPLQFQVKKQKQITKENLTQIIDQKAKNKQIPYEKQQTYEFVKIDNPPSAFPIFIEPEQKIHLKNEQPAEPQKPNERQLQMQNLMIKIQKRRQARQQQKRRIREIEEKRKQDEQRALEFMNQHNQNGQLNPGVSGILRLNDQLMHFSLAESVMDLQIKKLLKTNFNDFPNSSQIKYQIQELERINISYEMVRMDEKNPLRNGLRNYRVEIFNRIGQEIMKAQAQGYSNPNFHILEHDGRIGESQGSHIPQAIRGLPKENQRDFIQYVENIGDEDCTICLGGLKYRERVAKLECGHTFHSNCIEEWIQSSANCPTCRFNIKFGAKKI